MRYEYCKNRQVLGALPPEPCNAIHTYTAKKNSKFAIFWQP